MKPGLHTTTMAHHVMKNNNVLLAIIFLSLAFTYQVSGIFDWHYEGEVGTHTWDANYKICAEGKHQSPIDIITKDTVYNPILKEFVIWYNPRHPKGQMTIFNNGKTVKIKTMGKFYIANGGLKNIYKTDHAHLHWGKKNDMGSEHYLNSKAYAMELHIVNYDIKRFKNVQQAASQPLGLAVLGVIFEASDVDNPVLDIILNNIDAMQQPGHPKVKLEAQSLRSLLPKDISRYYRYNGSLTTPACYESVVWTIFEERNYVSKKQMQKLRDLFYVYDAAKEQERLKELEKINGTDSTNSSNNNATEKLVVDPSENKGNVSEQKNETSVEDLLKQYRFEMVNNFRPVQKLNDRVVQRSFETFKLIINYTTVKTETTESAANNNAIMFPWFTFLLLLLLYLCT